MNFNILNSGWPSPSFGCPWSTYRNMGNFINPQPAQYGYGGVGPVRPLAPMSTTTTISLQIPQYDLASAGGAYPFVPSTASFQKTTTTQPLVQPPYLPANLPANTKQHDPPPAYTTLTTGTSQIDASAFQLIQQLLHQNEALSKKCMVLETAAETHHWLTQKSARKHKRWYHRKQNMWYKQSNRKNIHFHLHLN